MRQIFRLTLLSATALGAYAQMQPMRARLTGSKGTDGKCTIEVRVDMSAEVEIAGDSGRLRTIAGQPATWRRMECTSPMPNTMADFRFQGVDGRGRQTLIQDPRSNRGVAVIRIEDSQGGAEGYTFDIEWSGAGQGGYQGGGFRGGDPGYRDNGGYRDRGRGFSTEAAIDDCRSRVRERAERDYGLRGIDFTSAGIDNGRRDVVTGNFTENRRGPSYRFSCVVDSNSGQIRNVEIERPDRGNWSGNGRGNYDMPRQVRVCQDAVVDRAGRDGYRDFSFMDTREDRSRNGNIYGRMTARRNGGAETFEFSCAMDNNGGRVRDVQLNRR